MINASELRNQGRVTSNPAPHNPAPYGAPASSSGVRHACPQCKGALIRIWRRRIDRLTSQFVPVHRFRCEKFSCGWEGNIRVDGSDGERKPSVLERAASASLVVLALLAAAALAVMLVAAMLGWISARDRQQAQASLGNYPCVSVIHAASPTTFARCDPTEPAS